MVLELEMSVLRIVNLYFYRTSIFDISRTCAVGWTECWEKYLEGTLADCCKTNSPLPFDQMIQIVIPPRSLASVPEHHLTVFCINPNDLALLFLTSIWNFKTGFFANGPHSHYLLDLQITYLWPKSKMSKQIFTLQFQDCLDFTPLPCMQCPIENETNR